MKTQSTQCTTKIGCGGATTKTFGALLYSSISRSIICSTCLEKYKLCTLFLVGDLSSNLEKMYLGSCINRVGDKFENVKVISHFTFLLQ